MKIGWPQNYLLTPLPTTPLYERLRAESRLDFTDPELIFHPKQMTREQLKAGFRKLLNRPFEVEAYFARIFDGAPRPAHVSPLPSPAAGGSVSLPRGEIVKRAAEVCFALMMRLIPRAYRFRAAWFVAGITLPLFRITSAYRQQEKIGFDGPHEIALHFTLNALTKNGTEFDPLITVKGYEEFERAYSAGKGVLVVGPHAALTLLMIRVFHDRGRDPVVITPDSRMRIAGTTVAARTLQPSRTFLVKARSRLRDGDLVCAMPDRARHHGKRTIEINTATGNVIVAPALMQLAVRCGAKVIFSQVHADRRGLISILAAPSAIPGGPDTITDDFVAFLNANTDLAATAA